MTLSRWRHGAVAGPSVGLLGALAVSVALAASSSADLSSAGLRPGDVPAGYGKPHTKVYTSYRKRMTIGKSAISTCTADPLITPRVWRQGMISESSRGKATKSSLAAIEECAYRLSSTAVAHAEYVYSLNGSKGKQGSHRLKLPRVGDESAAFSFGVGGIGGDDILFRHGDTVVGLLHISFGKPDVSPSALARIASVINGRL